MPQLSLALLLKLCTYACSATFHLFPFPNMKHETRSFVADISAVPLSAVGGLVPFISYEPLAVAWEATLAAVVIITNAACVAWQTCGQVGLATPVGRSDTPRTLCVCLYATRSFVVIGFATGFSCAWMGMVLSLVMSAVLADVVARAHSEEPTAKWARWHVLGVWGFHEDFHIALLGAELCWLVMVTHVFAIA